MGSIEKSETLPEILPNLDNYSQAVYKTFQRLRNLSTDIERKNDLIFMHGSAWEKDQEKLKALGTVSVGGRCVFLRSFGKGMFRSPVR